MDRDFFQKYYDSQVDEAKKYLSIVPKAATYVEINRFKGAVKNILIFIRLVKEMNPEFSPKKKVKKLQNLLKPAVKISNLQRQQILTRAWMRDKNHEMNGYYNYLKHRELNSRLKFEKAAKRIKPSTLIMLWTKISKRTKNMHLDYIKFKTEKRFENQINELIDLNKDNNKSEKKISKLGICAKEAQSLFEIIQLSNPTSRRLSKLEQSLRELNHLLENCYDLNNGLYLLSDFIENCGNNTATIKTLYSDYINYLTDQRKILLDEFDSKWGTFIDLAKKEREWISIL